MGFDMLFEILRALESLAAEIALVRLQRNMHTNVRGDMITLDRRGAAATPLTSQIEVVGAFATDVSLTHMVLDTAVSYSEANVGPKNF